MKLNQGFSVVEIILSIGLFTIFSTGAVFVTLQGLDINRLGNEETIANQYAAEGIEAIRSIKNQSFSALTNTGGTGISRNPQGQWILNGTNNTFDKYARTIVISDVFRDINSNIVQTGGIIDPNSKKIVSEVTWDFNSARNNSITLTNYLTDWKAPITNLAIGGILVYGNEAATSDGISYKLLDGTTNIWGVQADAADIDNSTNRVLRVARVYASSTRNEKILLSKHYDGTTQYIYAQVFNGAAWSSVILLSFWNTASFLDVKNFDGTYLQNGDFMVVFSDNTTVPKFRTWNGTNWSSQISLRNSGGIPTYVVARARPGTNEVMAGFFDQSSDTNTQYFNGGTYTTANWTLHTQHSAAAPSNTRELIAFRWSPNNPIIGSLIYSNSPTDQAMNVKIFTANGVGGGTWSGTDNTQNQGRLGAMALSARATTASFIACSKNINNDIYCFSSDTTPNWSTPVNNLLTLTTDTGIQRSFDIGYEAATGLTALAVYSDLTNIPKLKKYNAVTDTFDANATSLNPLASYLRTIALFPLEGNDDIMMILSDSSRNLYSLVWDGASDNVKAFTNHLVNGGTGVNYWYDFSWDKF